MKAFFDAVRPMFGGSFTQQQVDGLNQLLAATENMKTVRHRAYTLATAFHETARTMQPITEFGGRSYFAKYDAGTRIGKNLGNTQMGDGFKFRGRGYVQITGRANYKKAGDKLGVDLVGDPHRALNPTLAARILVRGMEEGWFTGKTLDDYMPDYRAARRIVNGTDRASLIAGYAQTFERALWKITFQPPDAEPTEPVQPSIWARFSRLWRTS